MWSPTHVQVLVRRAKGLNIKGKNGKIETDDMTMNFFSSVHRIGLLQEQMMLLLQLVLAKKNFKHLSKKKVKIQSGLSSVNCKTTVIRKQ